jgi:hypothetical protein
MTNSESVRGCCRLPKDFGAELQALALRNEHPTSNLRTFHTRFSSARHNVALSVVAVSVNNEYVSPFGTHG